MDPRHPEQAVSRLRELMKQYDRIENDMKGATTSAGLAELEREGGLVIQEICLVAPRIHEAMMQTSRIRRAELAKGLVEKPVVIEKLVETELDKEVNEVLKSLELDKEIEEKEEQEIKQSPKKKTTKRKKAE